MIYGNANTGVTTLMGLLSNQQSIENEPYTIINGRVYLPLPQPVTALITKGFGDDSDKFLVLSEEDGSVVAKLDNRQQVNEWLEALKRGEHA